MDVFDEYAKFYDVLYQDKDYMSEAKTVDGLLKKYGDNIQTLLVFGCGTGRHDRCLEKLGYRIHGIDLSEKMVKEAKSATTTIDYEVGDVRNYRTEQKYDAVISLFHVMSYQDTNEDIKNAFKSARNALKPEGIFLFDVWYGPGVLTDRPESRVKNVEFEGIKVIRRATPTMHPNENVVDVRYDFTIEDAQKGTKELTEEHHMRYYFKPEMEEYLNEAGFELLDILDCKTLEETNFNSWTCFFVAHLI